MPVVENVPEPLPAVEVITGKGAEMAKVVGVFEVKYDAAGKFRFHLKAASGEIVAVSQSYLTRQSAKKGIESVKKNAPTAKIIDHTIPET